LTDNRYDSKNNILNDCRMIGSKMEAIIAVQIEEINKASNA
jgi:hypothetical protein